MLDFLQSDNVVIIDKNGNHYPDLIIGTKKEIVGKAIYLATPPNFDNLLELAILELAINEAIEITTKNINHEWHMEEFHVISCRCEEPKHYQKTKKEIAKFIIDKIKELGSYSCKSSDVSDREKLQDPYSPTANWIQPPIYYGKSEDGLDAKEIADLENGGTNIYDTDGTLSRVNLSGAELPIYSKWGVSFFNDNIKIGCKEKSIKEWDDFFKSNKEIETKRGTEDFARIEAHYKAFRAYKLHMDKYFKCKK